jgi:2-methylisocitrate lyase-like PEP mutase family enzyme
MNDRREAFARLHRRGDPLFLPNAWDYATGAVLAQAGYPAIGTTSLGVAAAAGKPDAASETRQENLRLTRHLCRLPALITVDLESGFSDDPEEVAALAREVADAGAVGINIEDGRWDGTLSSADLHRARIAAVRSRVPELFINARTDTFWLAGAEGPPPIEETLRRAAAYVDAGADGIFVPSAADPETVAALSSRISAPLNILYMPGRHTFAQLAEAGAARVSTGSLLIREALRSVVQTARAAHQDAVIDDPDRPSYAAVQSALAGDGPG